MTFCTAISGADNIVWVEDEVVASLTIYGDEAKAAFRAAWAAPLDVRPAESRPASAFAGKSGQDMLNLSLSVDDPDRTLPGAGDCVAVPHTTQPCAEAQAYPPPEGKDGTLGPCYSPSIGVSSHGRGT